jgi:hypothetical protein
MSEMTDIVASKTFLEVCMSIEGLCADLYHYYSDIYTDNPGAARLWKKTALEEEDHRRQFDLALRLLHETEFEVEKESLKKAYSIQYTLLKQLEQVKLNKPVLHAAVADAVEMEELLADLHVQASLKFREESMKKLFIALGDADRDHVMDLYRYRTIQTLPYFEMRG